MWDTGQTGARVGGLADNTRGVDFYGRAGAIHDGRTRTTPISGGTMTDVRYLWALRGRVPMLDRNDSR